MRVGIKKVSIATKELDKVFAFEERGKIHIL